MPYTPAALFDFSKLPPELATYLASCATVLNALNRLPELLASLQGQGLQNHGTLMPGAVAVGDVYIGPGSVVHPCAVLEGPVFIGANVKISAHALLRDGAYVGNDCVVGHGADIKNSLVLPGAKVQINTFVGDSVLGRGARIGSGAILSNRKFNQTNVKIDLGDGPTDSGRDFLGAILGDQARIGANAVLSPGSVVGAYSWVGSGCVVQGSVPPDHLVTLEQTHTSRPKPRTELKSGLGEYYTL